VMAVMQARLAGLGATWADVTTVDIYTAHPLESFLATEVLAAMGPAAIHGVHWYLSHPPVAGLAYEMDLRGVRREVRLGLADLACGPRSVPDPWVQARSAPCSTRACRLPWPGPACPAWRWASGSAPRRSPSATA
jgi:hypothetical protein